MARGETPEVLQPAAHALDGVAVTVEEGRKAVLPLPVGLGRNVRHGLAVLDLAAEGVAVIALVAMQNIAGRHPCQKLRAGRAIRHLAASQHEGKGSALFVGQRMDFGRPSAS
jgi:hypothetical protein